MAQDERRGFEIVDDFPFMLRVSKHSEPFFSNLLVISSAIKAKELEIANKPNSFDSPFSLANLTAAWKRIKFTNGKPELIE